VHLFEAVYRESHDHHALLPRDDAELLLAEQDLLPAREATILSRGSGRLPVPDL
jgi:hypothetical protein